MTTTTAPQRAFDPTVPFSRADARVAGIKLRELLGPSYQRLFHDSYVCSSVPPTVKLRTRAALRRTGSETAFASHHTAGRLWGIPVPADGLVHVTAQRGGPRNRCRGVQTHRPISPSVSTTIHDGVPLSTPEQMFCELAAVGVGLVDLVVAGDAMLRAKKATRESLQKAIETMPGSGVRVARRALGYLRDGVDSPMESRLRMLLVLAGFPEPEVNFILRDANGDWDRRFDLWYRLLKLIVEYDGAQHGDLEHRDADHDRREELERLGYRIVAVTAHGIYTDPAKTLRRVAAVMRELGGHPPARWKPEWRQHFPGRR